MPNQNSLKSRLFPLIAVLASFLSLGAVQAQAATFKFNPPTAALTQGCVQSVNIDVDVTGENSNAADIEIHYDPAQVTIIDSDPNIPGVQIKNGNAYESYFASQVDTSAGKITLAGGSFIGNLTTKKVFATVQFKTVGAATSADFTIKFDGVGATLDSNIADTTTSNDLLTAVGNGSYTFTTGFCTADTQAPQVNFITPQGYQTNVPLNSNVTINITDNQSGIDLTSLKFIINGITYTVDSPEVTYTGTPLNYTFTINPPVDFPENQESHINVLGKDLAGNNFNRQIVFNIPPTVIPPPAPPVVCDDPTTAYNNFAGATNNVTIFKGTPLEGTIIDQIVNSAGANTVLNIITTTGFSLGFLQALTILNTPGLIYNFLAFLLGKGRGKTWGIVIDGTTGKPIAFAACRLYLEGTLNVHQQTVSDTEGRYGFAIQPGSYRLEVSQSGYDKFSRSITIEKNELSYVYDVKLFPAGLGKSDVNKGTMVWEKIKALYFKLRPYIFVAGFALALFSVLVSPGIVNVIIFVLYVAILGILLVSKFATRSKYAAIVDSSTNFRIPFALVKIFNLKTWELVDSQVTNTNGQFDFWGEPGEYGVLVSVRGYAFPSQKQNQYPVIDEKYSAMLKVKLTKGHNRLQIFVDPIESTISGGVKDATKVKAVKATGAKNAKSEPSAPGNLATPFG